MSFEKTIATYCPECDREVKAPIERRTETLPVKGESTSYEAEVAVCPFCGEIIGDSRVEGKNLRRAYSAYCSAHGLMTPDEVRGLRNGYGLSLREFSKFLGFGEQTVARYEAGAIPDDSHNTMLMLAATASGAASLLSVREGQLSEKVVVAVRRFIVRESSRVGDTSDLAARQWPFEKMFEPTDLNGNRALDMDRVTAVVCELASRCVDLYKTKLQKAMFFTDFLCYSRTAQSMTGLAYAHADYGPVMDGRDRIISILQDGGAIELVPKGWGEVVVPKCGPTGVLSADEIQLINEVAEFVNTFENAADISSFSHGLDAWRNTASGQPIGYAANAVQVADAIERRMGRW